MSFLDVFHQNNMTPTDGDQSFEMPLRSNSGGQRDSPVFHTSMHTRRGSGYLSGLDIQPDENGICPVCELCHYSHVRLSRNNNSGGGGNDCCPRCRKSPNCCSCPKDNSGKKPADPVGGSGKGDGSGDCGGNGSGKSGGGSGRNSPSNSGSNKSGGSRNSYAYSEMSCCVWLAIFIVSLAFLGLFLCWGSNSLSECLSPSTKIKYGFATSCPLDDKLARQISGKRPDQQGQGPLDSEQVPDHMKEEYKRFQWAAKNPECASRYKDRCPGLVNYAGYLAGATMISTRDTTASPNAMRCHCQDSGEDTFGTHCLPGDSRCSDCVCDPFTPDIMLKDDEKLFPGRCYAFRGEGKFLISLFFPTIIYGVSVHHPTKSQLLPGFFSSAPKDFEVWGYQSKDDPDPHLYGKFEYIDNNDATPTQIFEAKNLILKPYKNVQFNFLTNHGNPNYTAVYKLEVHGSLDRNSFID